MPGRVGPLAGIVVKVELDGDALADPAVAQVAAAEAQGVGAVPLDREGEAVGQSGWCPAVIWKLKLV